MKSEDVSNSCEDCGSPNHCERDCPLNENEEEKTN